MAANENILEAGLGIVVIFASFYYLFFRLNQEYLLDVLIAALVFAAGIAYTFNNIDLKNSKDTNKKDNEETNQKNSKE